MCSETFTFEGLVLLTAFISMSIFPQEDRIAEIFAHSGHISLFVSTALATNSMSFLIASAICFAFLFIYDRIAEALSILLGACYYIQFTLKMTDSIIQPWSDRFLWHCDNGQIGFICILCYTSAIVLENFIQSCTEYHALFAIHVGGIFSVCVFILPQVSFTSFTPFKIIVSVAALADGLMCSTRIYFMQSFDKYTAIRAIFAILSGAVIMRLKQIASNDNLDGIVETRTDFKHLRMLGVLCYMLVSFVQYVNTSTAVNALGQITHFALIVGGIAMEAVIWNDKLMTRVAQTLVLFETIGILFDNSRFLFKPLVLLLSLPQYPRAIKNVFAFDFLSV